MSENHHIIVHAYTKREDADGVIEEYLDDRVPFGTPVFWTAYERIFDGDGDYTSPWEADANSFDEIERLVRARCVEVGLDPAWGVRVETYPEDVYYG